MHFALFLDYVWLYCAAILRAVEQVVASSASDLDHSLKRWLFGGEIGYRERELMVQELSELRKTLEGDKLAETEESFSLLPHYYPELLELVTRFTRKPRSATEALRCSEWLNIACFAGGLLSPLKGFPADPSRRGTHSPSRSCGQSR